MLNSTHRLGKKTPILLNTPTKMYTNPYFSLKMRKNDVAMPRFQFVISKKVDKRAVVRNTLKRRMANAVASLLSEAKGQDYIFYMKKAALEKTVEELGDSIKDLRFKI